MQRGRRAMCHAVKADMWVRSTRILPMNAARNGAPGSAHEPLSCACSSRQLHGTPPSSWAGWQLQARHKGPHGSLDIT